MGSDQTLFSPSDTVMEEDSKEEDQTKSDAAGVAVENGTFE
jgi:hypothetical protein